MVSNAKDVAQNILLFSQEHGDVLTNLKLQKLLYYCQGWHLALKDNELLFTDPIQAWIKGPVIPNVYHQYKDFKWQPIVIEDQDAPALAEGSTEIVKEVLEVYGGYSAYQLELMTHEESPWLIARGSLPLDESSNNVISTQDMYGFFSSELAAANA